MATSKELSIVNKMQPVLEFIITEINKVNADRTDGPISEDSTNEELLNIFHDAGNRFANVDFDISDDEDALVMLFGYEGYCAIREAEQGNQ